MVEPAPHSPQSAVPPPPIAPPRPESGSKPDNREIIFRDLVETMKAGQVIQEQLLKEHTQVVAANTRSMDLLRRAIVGEEPSKEHPEGVDGLIDVVAEQNEVADPLGEALTATNINLARILYIVERSMDIAAGDAEAPELPEGQEPEAGKVYKQGRTPLFVDVVAALRQWNKEAEEEEKKDAEEEERAKLAEESQHALPPSKPSMIGNPKPKGPPAFRSLPPLPVAPPLPGGAATKG